MLIGAKMLLPAITCTPNCGLRFAKKGAADQRVSTVPYKL